MSKVSQHFWSCPPKPLVTMSIEGPESSHILTIAEEYHEATMSTKEDFGKEKASGLSPHRHYDCVIYLMPEIMPPRNHRYPLSMTEMATLEQLREAKLFTI